MGLEVGAIRKARFVHNLRDCRDGNHHCVWVSSEFRERLDGHKVGCYISRAKWFEFTVGSYIGYNQWRELLSCAVLGVVLEEVWANPKRYRGKPFFELIHMDDNAGAFGSKTSRKLAADFEAFEKTIEAKVRAVIKKRHLKRWLPLGDDIGWWLKLYANWQQAFEVASDSGFVMLF